MVKWIVNYLTNKTTVREIEPGSMRPDMRKHGNVNPTRNGPVTFPVSSQYINYFTHNNELRHLQKFSDSAKASCIMKGDDAHHRELRVLRVIVDNKLKDNSQSIYQKT